MATQCLDCGAGVGSTVDRRARHKAVHTGCRSLFDRVGVDAAVDLDQDRQLTGIHQLPHGGNLGEHLGYETLPPESRFHRHHQQSVEVAQDLQVRLDRSAGLDRQPRLGTGGTDAGGLWIVRGPVTTLVDLAAADWSVRGDTAYTGLGRAVTPLDIDGDGRLDLHVGGARDTSSRGDVRVFLAPNEGEALASEAHALLIGAEPGDNAGVALAPGGDPDADGDTEVLIGAPGASAVYVLVGGPGL